MINVSGKSYDCVVAKFAVNAKVECIYVNALQLSEMMGIISGNYNGIWSMNSPSVGGDMVNKANRLESLEKNAISNNTSAIINQITGALIGGILIFKITSGISLY